jgi:hypothetical protein
MGDHLRKRAAAACEPCRSAKVRCGHERPCARCLAKGISDQCDKNAMSEADAKNENIRFMSHFESLRLQAEMQFKLKKEKESFLKSQQEYDIEEYEASRSRSETQIQRFTLQNYYKDQSEFEVGNGLTLNFEVLLEAGRELNNEDESIDFPQKFEEGREYVNSCESYSHINFNSDAFQGNSAQSSVRYSSSFMNEHDFSLDSSFKRTSVKEASMTISEIYLEQDQENVSNFDSFKERMLLSAVLEE